MPDKKMAPPEAEPRKVSTNRRKHNDTDTKWRRILRILATGAKLTRFDAERSGDHALNSTVAALESMGARIARQSIVIVGRYGTIRCKLYWIEPAERGRAWALLGEGP